jgi:hypothetical protein
MKSTMKLDGIAMITRVVVWQKGYFRHKQGNTSCIVIVDLKFHTKRRKANFLLKKQKINLTLNTVSKTDCYALA